MSALENLRICLLPRLSLRFEMISAILTFRAISCFLTLLMSRHMKTQIKETILTGLIMVFANATTNDLYSS